MTTATEVFEGTFEADAIHSSLEAGTTHMGVGSFRTRFDELAASLVADESGVPLQGTAPVESISIRNPPEFREHVVNGSDFFDALKHPTIEFSSREVSLHPDGTLELVGLLTIKGISREITATGTYRPPTTDFYDSVRAAIDLSTTVDRRAFGIDWQQPLPGGGNALGWDVTLNAHLEFIKI